MDETEDKDDSEIVDTNAKHFRALNACFNFPFSPNLGISRQWMQDLQMALLQLTHWPDFFFLDLTGILDLTVTGIVFLVENLTDLVTFMGVALFLLLCLSQRGELVHDVLQRGLLAILLLLW